MPPPTPPDVPRHVLVTNDFPPKLGGIQTYLWELWRRLPPSHVTVLTTAYEGAEAFDATQPYRIDRLPEPVLLPTRKLADRIADTVGQTGAELIVLDPAIPLGLLGPRLTKQTGRPYALVVHGSELIGRIPGGSRLMGHAVRHASAIVAAGNYPADEARRTAGGPDHTPPITVVPPGVDVHRFRPLDVDHDGLVVVGLSRLVPRKGFDVLIEAAARLRDRHPTLMVLIGGTGPPRERARLQARIDATRAPVKLVGRVSDEDMPAFYAGADVFAMCCRTRWAGLEPEGFGIVFMEAAAAGIPQVAGDSGGAADAVEHEQTGILVANPEDPAAVAHALDRLLADPALRARMGQAARHRAERDFTYDALAPRLAAALTAATTVLTADSRRPRRKSAVKSGGEDA